MKAQEVFSVTCAAFRVVFSDHASGLLQRRRLQLAERYPEQQHRRAVQSQMTRMGFIIIQQLSDLALQSVITKVCLRFCLAFELINHPEG